MSGKDISTSAHQHIDPIVDLQVKKLPYSPPMLSILEADEIAGGIDDLLEADGGAALVS